MGLLRSLANRFDPERRDLTLKDPFYAERLGGIGTSTGQNVTPDRASGIAAVHACVQLISETTATLPLAPYRMLEDGREIDRDHPLYPVLHEQANRVQTAAEFREQFVASCLLTGNGYAEKVIGPDGAIRELIPIHPDYVTVEKLVNGRVRYQVRESGNNRTLTQDEVLHLRYRSRDGYTGISPIQIARETVGMALAHQEHEGAFYRNGLAMSGVITSPHTLTADQMQTIHDSLMRGWTGANKFRAMVLSFGLDYKPIAMSHEDAQFVESRKLNLEDIARIYRVPPPAIGILDRATYANITEQSRHLVAYCLRPWLVRIEQAMNASLLSEDGRRTHFIEHNAEGLLRGAQGERYQAYEIGRRNAWLSVNEIRKFENMNPVQGGDDYSRESAESRSAPLPITLEVKAPQVTVRNELPEYEATEQEAVRDQNGRLTKMITTKRRTS
jgi:HK97 family phage portal protein